MSKIKKKAKSKIVKKTKKTKKTKKKVIEKAKKSVKSKTKSKKASLVEKIWKQQSITHNNCFLCAKKLNEKNKTVEHVFPKWLQHRHNLWNQKLILPNTTGIPYRLITIPCCKKCNGGYLSKLEKQIKAAFETGYDAVSALPKIRLFQWLQLFSYKLLYKDISLLADRRNPDLGTIFSPQDLELFKISYTFMQSVFRPTDFSEFFPASIIIVRTKSGGPLDFEFMDNVHARTIAVRSGDVGVIAILQDNQAVEQATADFIKKIKPNKLSPLQFKELVVKNIYASILMNRIPKFIIYEKDKGLSVSSLPLQGMSTKPIFNPWDKMQYNEILAHYLEVPFENLYSEEGQRTFIMNDKGEFMDIPYEAIPVGHRVAKAAAKKES